MASHFFFLLILCLLTLSRASESPRKHALFVFGDSFFDPGNNNYINTSTLDQANFPPYGETHFHFPTGRFSDGRIIPDFILEYAKLPLIPPYMSPRSQMYYRIGANFASAGAGALAETFQGAVISLQTQLSNHKTVEERLRKIYGNTEAKNTLSKAVYLFSIGTNDYISPYLITNSTRFNSTYSNSQLVQIVIGNLTTAIKELHKRGGRKFGFLNLGPLGCLPGIRIILNPSSDSGGCIEAASLLAKLHNQALAKSLKRLAKQLHGFKYSLYDFNTNLNQRLKHPSKYGYKQGKTACCGTGRFRGTFSCGGKRPVKEFQLCKNPKEQSVIVEDQLIRHMAQSNPLLVAFSCLSMLAGCLSSRNHFNEHVTLFVFGDSLFDPGNNNYINTTTSFQANFWPYGKSYFNPPSGRFSNGRLISDFIAEYARLPLIPAYLDPQHNEFVHGANFASGGAGALVETHAGFVVNLRTQLEYFRDLKKHFRQNLGDVKAEQLLSNAVYLFSFGGNDYLTPVGNNDSVLYPYTHDEYVGMVIGNLTNTFKGIYKMGGRKFGILNVPPLACLPSIRAGRSDNTCNKELDIISSLHNQKLSKKLQELEKHLEGFKYAKFDFSTAVSNRMNNPSKYGFKVGNSACCGSGPYRGIYSCGGKRGLQEYELCDNINDYLFFDSYHPNEVANRQYSELFWKADSNVTTPYNLKTLFQEGVPNARGRILGGSSVINAGFYSRADDEFYERSGISFDYELIERITLSVDREGDCVSTGVAGVAVLVKRWGYLSSWGIPVVTRSPYVGQFLYDNPRNGISFLSPMLLYQSLIQVVGTSAIADYRFWGCSNYFSNARICREFRFVGAVLPGNQSSDEEMGAFCRQTVNTIWHCHGGCLVGRVVDLELRVLGVGSLRVIDGTVFSISPGTSPQATVLILGRHIAFWPRLLIVHSFIFVLVVGNENLVTDIGNEDAFQVLTAFHGKVVAQYMQRETAYFTDLKPTGASKAIEVRVYRKWTAMKVPSLTPTYFCCILLDKKDSRRFGFENTDKWQKTLDNNITLKFWQVYPDRPFASMIFYNNNVVTFTLWNEKAETFEEDDYIRMRQPVMLKDMQVKYSFLQLPRHFTISIHQYLKQRSCWLQIQFAMFKVDLVTDIGQIQLSTTPTTFYYINPPIPETEELLAAYDQLSISQSLINISKLF
ncbi:Lipase, GDSL [Artemisia annua]|uniref:Lipase, GDSL n=1 Tax=Artemisia annua TaxID=35608 RepID=A0A2U1P433_ARTAN|nr:Lipase, GDSL [Artemisia annua]